MRTHWKLKLSVAMLLCCTVSSVGFVTAKAATWHKGTPKVLRGTYQMHRTMAVEGYGSVITINQKSFMKYISNWPVHRITHAKYRLLKQHIYLLAGHLQKNSYIPGGPYTQVVYKKGNKLLLTDYYSYKKYKMKSFKYAAKNPAVKTKHAKNGGPVIPFR